MYRSRPEIVSETESHHETMILHWTTSFRIRKTDIRNWTETRHWKIKMFPRQTWQSAWDLSGYGTETSETMEKPHTQKKKPPQRHDPSTLVFLVRETERTKLDEALEKVSFAYGIMLHIHLAEDRSLWDWSPRVHLHVVGMLCLCLWHKLTEVAQSFSFCSCVYFCLYGPFQLYFIP